MYTNLDDPLVFLLAWGISLMTSVLLWWAVFSDPIEE